MAAPCDSNPCLNGGSCTVLPSGDFSCHCITPTYTGERCESIISTPQFKLANTGTHISGCNSSITMVLLHNSSLTLHMTSFIIDKNECTIHIFVKKKQNILSQKISKSLKTSLLIYCPKQTSLQ